MRAPDDRSAAVKAAMTSMAVDLVTGEMVRALRVEGIRAIVLKGPTVARWLYRDGPPREYGDTDLLVSPSSVPAAERLLEAHGFRKQLDELDIPGWQQGANVWHRAESNASVDLHWDLIGVAVPATQLWDVLSSQTETMEVASTEVEVLGPAARALHVVLHAAQHGPGWERGRLDVERAAGLLEDATWHEAAALAVRLEATAALTAGLRLCPQGSALADRLGLPTRGSLETALVGASRAPGALSWHLLHQASASERLSITARKLVPSRRFMRHWKPIASRGRLGLLVAYLWRPLWLLWHAVPGFRAWRRARRSS